MLLLQSVIRTLRRERADDAADAVSFCRNRTGSMAVGEFRIMVAIRDDTADIGIAGLAADNLPVKCTSYEFGSVAISLYTADDGSFRGDRHGGAAVLNLEDDIYSRSALDTAEDAAGRIPALGRERSAGAASI